MMIILVIEWHVAREGQPCKAFWRPNNLVLMKQLTCRLGFRRSPRRGLFAAVLDGFPQAFRSVFSRFTSFSFFWREIYNILVTITIR